MYATDTIPDVCQVGILVTASDAAWLYAKPEYQLKVIGRRRSLAEGSRGEWQIRLRVTQTGISKPIELWQFAHHYVIATPDLIAERTAIQQRSNVLPWARAVSLL